MQDSDKAFNDDRFDHLCQKDDVSSRKSWRKRFCCNNLKPTNVQNGVCGTKNVLHEFHKFYNDVAQPNTLGADSFMAEEVEHLLSINDSGNCMIFPVCVDDVMSCIGSLKRHKAAGPDNITNEHLLFAGISVFAMIRHRFVPSDFCNGIIVPLLKSKHGDPTSLDMYRGITLSPVLSKVFESILLRLYGDFLSSDPVQFGFKKNSRCSHALFALTETVKYLTKKGSKVSCSFLDASKAFDKILHNGLFSKLLKRGAPVIFVRLLRNWYSDMQCCVKWNNMIGDAFPILCRIRQGSVLSPYLFPVYVDDLVM